MGGGHLAQVLMPGEGGHLAWASTPHHTPRLAQGTAPATEPLPPPRTERVLSPAFEQAQLWLSRASRE